MRYNITATFFCIDEFCKAYDEWEKHRLIDTGKKRHRSCEMSLSEMLTIMVIFHLSPCKNFKYFYIFHLPYFHKSDFPKLLSYSRFLQLMPRLFVYYYRVCLENKQELILLMPHPCPFATTNVLTAIVYLKGWQRGAKQQWAGSSG